MSPRRAAPAGVAMVALAGLLAGAQPALVDGVAAVIGRKVITLSEVRAEGRMVLIQRAGRLGIGRSLDVAFLRTVLDYVLVQELIVQRARRDGVVVVEAEVDRGTAVFKARFDSEQQYKDFLRTTGIDEEFLRTVVRRDLAVAELLRRRAEAHPLEVDPAAISAFLSSNPTFYPDQPERVRERAARDAIVQETRKEELARFVDELKASVEVRVVAAWARPRSSSTTGAAAPEPPSSAGEPPGEAGPAAP